MTPNLQRRSPFGKPSPNQFPSRDLARRARICACLCFALLAGWLSPKAVNGADLVCPPAAGAPAPVPGVPGETGWLLNTEVDDAGNKIELWCLQPGNGHGGPDFGVLYRPKTGAPVWTGACVFPEGRNHLNKQFVDTSGGPNGEPNGKPDIFSKITYYNVEYYSGGTNAWTGTNDWEYSLDPATGKLIIGKSTGRWVKVPGGYQWGRSNVVYETNSAAPGGFGGLKFGSNQITASIGVNGRALESYGAVFSNTTSGRWEYALRANAFEPASPDTNSSSIYTSFLTPADSFTIGAVDITTPQVTGLAALPAYGAWTVARFDGSFVTYRPTTTAQFPFGAYISGFVFYSQGTQGEVFWDLASPNEQFSSSGTVTGPVLRLSYNRTGSTTVLYWQVPTATLEAAPSLDGPWFMVPATLSYNVPPGVETAFFRLSWHP
jgi:hypothetical protein